MKFKERGRSKYYLVKAYPVAQKWQCEIEREFLRNPNPESRPHMNCVYAELKKRLVLFGRKAWVGNSLMCQHSSEITQWRRTWIGPHRVFWYKGLTGGTEQALQAEVSLLTFISFQKENFRWLPRRVFCTFCGCVSTLCWCSILPLRFG